MNKMRSIDSFRYDWLKDFFLIGQDHKKIPPNLMTVLSRKLDMINAAISYRDLRSPPANRFEGLGPPLVGYYSIRVNEQYRLIFTWRDSKACDLYLDAHSYKKHR